jgi:hypothetical protein
MLGSHFCLDRLHWTHALVARSLVDFCDGPPLGGFGGLVGDPGEVAED